MSFVVAPPPPQQRMHFMDALEEERIDYTREPDGYYIYLRESQWEAWESIRLRFQAEVVDEDPAMMVDV
jgi:hypothetical protein